MQDAREKIIRYYKGTEGEAVAVKLVDFAAQTIKNHKCKLTGFLSPFEQEMAGVIANSLGELNVDFYGGYGGAEPPFVTPTLKARRTLKLRLSRRNGTANLRGSVIATCSARF